ncbi:MAG: 1,6-anhydro-N-acetylmuramyl-L-alanine amidase AmpD, partial [Steroidobacteraceae bacterium]|nr:1,6-anhydro-N-acetylmuramyl-L-alanine amidase AmpD [Steroidobacteraceae bacterium]
MSQALVIDVATGLLRGVRQVLSPHCDPRPSGSTLDLIVLHGISLPPGEFGGPWIEAFFCGNLPADGHPFFASVRGLRVAAHFLIRRDGSI